MEYTVNEPWPDLVSSVHQLVASSEIRLKLNEVVAHPASYEVGTEGLLSGNKVIVE
jgi:hypothetical protein